jgi:hypothetical protein
VLTLPKPIPLFSAEITEEERRERGELGGNTRSLAFVRLKCPFMTRHVRRGLWVGIAVTMLLSCASENSAQTNTQLNAQTDPFKEIEATAGQLKIEAPEIVHPGETQVIRVSSPEKLPFTLIGVVAKGPIGINANLAKSLPAEFTYEVPQDLSCEKYLFWANAAIESTKTDMTAHAEVDVEPMELPLRLGPNLRELFMEISPYGGFPVRIDGYFADGTSLDLSSSTRIKYESTDKGLATVREDGLVQGVASGKARIKIVYSSGDEKRELLVPVSVAPAREMPEKQFTVEVSPESVTLTPGRSARFDISVSPVANFSGAVALEFHGFVGAKASFKPARIEGASGMATLVVAIDASVPPGEYKTLVTGANGESYTSAALKIEVVAR